MPLLLVSYAVRAMFLAKIIPPSPCYDYRNFILFQQKSNFFLRADTPSEMAVTKITVEHIPL